MDYRARFAAALEALHTEGRYRVFADIKRDCGQFPHAVKFEGDTTRKITVWCSNDYLGQGQNPVVLQATGGECEKREAGGAIRRPLSARQATIGRRLRE